MAIYAPNSGDPLVAVVRAAGTDFLNINDEYWSKARGVVTEIALYPGDLALLVVAIPLHAIAKALKDA